MSGRRQLGIFFGLLALSAMVYAQTIGTFFLSDDFDMVRAVQRDGPFGLWTVHTLFLRPAASVSAWLDLHLWGLRPAGFHFTNLLLHAATAFALLKLALRFGLGALPAVIVAVLFVVAPAHAEAVAWPSCRSDLVAACAGLFACWLWMRASDESSLALRLLAAGLLITAMFAKESAVPLTLGLCAWEVRHSRFRWAAVAAAFVPLYLCARRLLLGSWIGGYGLQVHARFDAKELLGNLVFYPLRALTGLFSSTLLPVVGLCLFITAVVIGIRRKLFTERVVTFACAYLLLLLPVLNLGVSRDSTSGERFLYLPSAFLFATVAALLWPLISARPRVAIALTLVLGAASVARLQTALAPFRHAGQLAEQLLPEIVRAARPAPLTLVNLPDNLRGAYVFRNGLPSALELYGPGTHAAQIIALHGIQSRNEPVTLEASAHRIVLQLTDPRSRIFGFSLPEHLQGSNPIGADAMRLNGPPPPNLWGYSSGHIRELRAGP